ncbi:MAG: prepilin-type N-terminal cleavage/methylation domain-containing protein [Paucibacter sp.]|nr:prepilin-type N-terminal cleavage/methylation domain-containing protein [Roseateles sp.]
MNTLAHQRRQRGVAMLEAMIAVVILAIGLIGTVGMQARAYAALNDAGLRAEATMAAEKLLGTMNADAANLANYALSETGAPSATIQPWVSETRTHIPGAKLSVVLTPQVRRTQVDVSIKWTRRAGDAENRHLVTSYIGS